MPEPMGRERFLAIASEYDVRVKFRRKGTQDASLTYFFGDHGCTMVETSWLVVRWESEVVLREKFAGMVAAEERFLAYMAYWEDLLVRARSGESFAINVVVADVLSGIVNNIQTKNEYVIERVRSAIMAQLDEALVDPYPFGAMHLIGRAEAEKCKLHW